VLNSASSAQTCLGAFAEQAQQQKERSQQAVQAAESAFFACLNDNNRIREKYGLDPVLVHHFLPAGVGVDMSLFGAASSNISASSSIQEDVFFDAEQGDSGTSSDSDNEASMHEAEEFLLDQEDTEGGDSHVPNKEDATVASSTVTTVVPVQKVKRRSALPAPTYSLQNISIMSILRNNVILLVRHSSPSSLTCLVTRLERICQRLPCPLP
jgi:hypothetical protein